MLETVWLQQHGAVHARTKVRKIILIITMMGLISAAFVTALHLCLSLQTASAKGSVIAAPPQDVHFYSINLRNLLLWSPGKDTAHGATYTVEYATYGDALGGSDQVAWKPAEQCRDITDTECDLTDQTDEMDEDYFARVKANGPNSHSHWVETERRFRPFSDTIMGPPKVKVILVENYMHVKLKGPFQWKSSRMKKGCSLWKIFPRMVYNISVFNNKSKNMQHILLQNDTLKWGPLEYESEHCVKAEAYSRFLPLSRIQSDWICLTIPSDPLSAQMMMLIFGGVIPSAICLFILAAVGAFTYYYICDHRQKLPTSTEIVSVEETGKTFQPEKPLIINLNLFSTNLSTEEWKQKPLGALYHDDSENEHLLPILALPSGSSRGPEHPQPQGEIVPSYAAQQIQPDQDQAGFDTASDASADLWSSHGFLTDDYGLVACERLQQDPHQHVSGLVVGGMANMSAQPSECKVNVHKAQSEERDPGEKRYEEEEQEEEEEKEKGTLVDWDPRTGVLKIPLLYQISSEETKETEADAVTATETRVNIDLLQRKPILTSLVFRQSSQESSEEDIFTKMEKDWGLQIQSNAE
ncbi:interleukin-20 receptor subunit alpha [Astyanax mexicanus]|uniref:interleukin-20 receptor subunit alpha n=1 Tax=Astyanax mexicanus TaxID=7994 RepID=UPI0020CAA894|nr:interleukin-20 receptor subunit alpha [Astyanax mexicanus]